METTTRLNSYGAITQSNNKFKDGKRYLNTSESVEMKLKPAPPFSFNYFKELSKFKLASFVVLTTMAGYAMAPGASELAILGWATMGTGLCVASANSFNQWVEMPYDAQMSRTRNRVLVRHAMTPTQAFLFGAGSGIVGVGMLWSLVNPYTALLGGLNIIIYACIYTPMKRTSIANTWAGAFVGAIPPLMGWVANTGGFELGGWLLAAILYAWQFPHFNALSWNLRKDYSKAGYRMMSVTHPDLNARVSLRYALAMFPLSYACCAIQLTHPYFFLASNAINFYMAYYAFKFYRNSNEQTARALFFSSLVHLPVFIALLILFKDRQEQIDEEVSMA